MRPPDPVRDAARGHDSRAVDGSADGWAANLKSTPDPADVTANLTDAQALARAMVATGTISTDGAILAVNLCEECGGLELARVVLLDALRQLDRMALDRRRLGNGVAR